ncbi:MAG: tetratricopeptide repeat protein [Bdellovibrionales bacterium]|nr:tetratricopeptide repeat protein [Bdellovibrionales bacterium]
MNKNKELAKAQKYLQKNKYDDALEVYRKVTQIDPSDVRVWMKKGELEARLHRKEEAKNSYETVAKQYTKEGFYLKAVAVYKKIFKLDPHSVHYHVQLAELYGKLGLDNEAKKNYAILADFYLGKGQREKYIEILQKMIELDPHNSEYKIRLGETYASAGQVKSATQEFQAVTAKLIKRNDIEGLGLLQEKIMNLDVENNDIQFAIVSDFLKGNEPKAALVILQKLYHLDSENPKILKYLGKCFEHLKQPDKARSVYRELSKILIQKNESAALREIEEKIKELNKALDIEEPKKPEQKVVESKPSTNSKVVTTTFDRDVKQVSSSAPKVEKRNTVENEKVSPVRQDLHKKNTLSSTKEKELINESEYLVDSDRVSPLNQMKDINAYEIDEDFMSELNMQRSSPIEIDEELSLDDLSFEVSDLSDEVSGLTQTAQKNDETEIKAQEISENLEEVSLDLDSEDDLLIEVNDQVSHSDETKQQEYFDLQSKMDGFTLSSPSVDISESSLDHFEQDVEVSFASFIEPTKERDNEKVESEHEDLSDLYDFSQEPSGDSSSMQFQSFPLDDDHKDSQPDNVDARGLSQKEKIPLDTEFLRVSERLEKSSEISSAKVPSTFLEENSIQVREEYESTSTSGEGFSLFDLSVELKQEILQLESRLEESRASYDEEYLSPEEVILEFKKGIAKTVPKDDYQTHYNLGIAYKEMGLLDEAISEFELSVEDPNLYLDSCSMIGLCLFSKKEYGKAIALYEHTLKSLPNIKNIKALGLCYELAEAYIGGGRHHEAYALFVKITKIDPGYRDCKKRVRELEFSLGIAQGKHVEGVSGEEKENILEFSDRKKDKDKISFF